MRSLSSDRSVGSVTQRERGGGPRFNFDQRDFISSFSFPLAQRKGAVERTDKWPIHPCAKVVCLLVRSTRGQVHEICANVVCVCVCV